jgi:hypothetical protein
MVSDKQTVRELKHNPGVMIGREEMAKFLKFVKELARKAEMADRKIKLS